MNRSPNQLVLDAGKQNVSSAKNWFAYKRRQNTSVTVLINAKQNNRNEVQEFFLVAF